MPPGRAVGLVDRWFHISARGSSVAVEIKAGVVTFLTMSYILLVNPLILGEAGLPIKEVVTSTALTSAVASLGVGLFANLPVGIAPGMGLNAYLVFSQVLGAGVAVEVALACCLTAAVLVAVLALIRALSLILNMVPDSIKLAVVVGMGLLLSFIGLQTAQVVVKDEETMVKLGDLTSAKALLALLGLTLIATLHHHQVPGAIIIGIIGTAVGWFALENTWPHEFVAMPTLGVWKLDFGPVLALDSSALSAVGAYTLVMIFDIGGAMYGLGNLAGLVKDGAVPGAIATYLSAAAGTALGAFTGTTPLIIAAESAVGIKEGGRTGLVGVTVAACFGASLFLAPILQAVPPVATAPVLVLVGAMMMGEAGHINWISMPTALPAFLTMVIQPFTFSIANGIYAGLIFSALLYITTGQVVTHVRSLMRSPSADLDVVEGGGLSDPLLPGGPGHPHPPPGLSPHHPPGGSPSAPVDFKRTSVTVATNIVRSLAHNAAASPLYAQTTHDLLIGTPSRPGFQQAAHGYGSSGAQAFLDTSLQHPAASRPSGTQQHPGGTWS